MEYLKHFITEEIYILPQKVDAAPSEQLSSDKDNIPITTAKSQSGNYPATIICNKLNDDDKKLLDGILSAVKLDPKKVQLINTYENISAEKVLIFGNFPELKSISRYQPVKHEGKSILIADELGEIQQEVSKKQMLWKALQRMFSL